MLAQIQKNCPLSLSLSYYLLQCSEVVCFSFFKLFFLWSQITHFPEAKADAEVTSLRRRFEALSSHLSSVGKLETFRFTALFRNFSTKNSSRFWRLSVLLAGHGHFQVSRMRMCVWKKTLQDCMATRHTGIHLFDSTCMLASCINCQTCSR